MTRVVRVASGVLAPGHIGELTRIVPFEMVDAVLADTRCVERRRRLIPARVVVYLLLAAGLFENLGWLGVWDKLAGAVDSLKRPAVSGLAYARARLGAAPMRALFGLLAGGGAAAARWRGLLVCAIDGTMIDVPDTGDNRSVYGLHAQGGLRQAGYPQVRLVALIACGSRMLLGSVFGSSKSGETTMATGLLGAMTPGQLVLADRGFASTTLFTQIRATKADFLIRLTSSWKPAIITHLGDGSKIVVYAGMRLRLIDAEISIATTAGTVTGSYRLITTLLDCNRYPATELAALYHQRWEVETVYCELKSTLLRRAVLRAGHPVGVEQEIWSLLCLYQILRTTMTDAVTDTNLTPLQTSFKTAVETARDLLIRAENVIDGETIDLTGHIGRQLLANPLPDRRVRTAPRVVKRAISKHRAKGHVNRRTYKATLKISVLQPP